MSKAINDIKVRYMKLYDYFQEIKTELEKSKEQVELLEKENALLRHYGNKDYTRRANSQEKQEKKLGG